MNSNHERAERIKIQFLFRDSTNFFIVARNFSQKNRYSFYEVESVTLHSYYLNMSQYYNIALIKIIDKLNIPANITTASTLSENVNTEFLPVHLIRISGMKVN